MQIPTILEQLLSVTVEHRASDLHLRTNRHPILRIGGHLQQIETEPMTLAAMQEIVEYLESQQPFGRQESRVLQKDTALHHEELGRFRVSVFYERNRPALSFRYVKREIPPMEQLLLPADALRSLLQYPQGLILFSGPTGAGKSTTLASLLQDMASRVDKHVITLEDPIEYLFEDSSSVFTQREIGIDTENFPIGLRAALRQDPDIIVIGELRDAETFQVALRAAETGHLVISTTHASNTTQTLERLLEFCDPSQDNNGLRRIAECLRGVVSQRLLPGMNTSQVPVLEYFRPGPSGREFIYKGEFSKIQDMLDESPEEGSFSFSGDLYRHVMEARITKGTAMAHAPNPRALEMRMKGIVMMTGRTML